MKLCIKYQRPGSSAFRQEDFQNFPYMGLCKTSDPRRGAIFLPKGYNLNTFGRNPPDEATYQNLKTWFQTRRFFRFSVKKSIVAPVT